MLRTTVWHFSCAGINLNFTGSLHAHGILSGFSLGLDVLISSRWSQKTTSGIKQDKFKQLRMPLSKCPFFRIKNIC